MEPVLEIERKITLEGVCESWDDARSVLLGVPLDTTSSYRAGSRFAPETIRGVFWESMEDYSLRLGSHFTEARLFDWGNVVLPRGNITREIEVVKKAVDRIVGSEKKPLLLGGEHAVTVAAAKSVRERYPDLQLIHLDAHADLRESYMGEELSHASVIYYLLEQGLASIYQVGIRSCTVDEAGLARQKTGFYPYNLYGSLQEVVSAVGQKPVYVSLDIDVVDPAYAPGTGTPEPGGATSSELLEALVLLKGLNLVGFDLVEVSPPYDCSNITSILAAKILREVAVLLDI